MNQSRIRVARLRCGTLIISLAFIASVSMMSGARGQSQNIVWQTSGIGHAVAFSPDGQTLLAGNQLRNASDGQVLRIFNLRHGTEVNAAAFSPDGQYCAIGVQSFNLNLNFFRVSDGFRTVPTEAHNNGTTTIDFSPDGQFVATGGRDGTVKLWHVPDFTLVKTFLGGPGYRADVFAIHFSAEGQFLAVGGRAGLIILRVSDGQIMQTLADGSTTVRGLALSRDGGTLAAGFFTAAPSGAYQVKLWRFNDGTLLNTIDASNQPINSVAFDPGGAVIASGGGDDDFAGVVRFFKVSDGSQLGYFPQDPNNLSSYVTSIAYPPNGQFVAYARADNVIIVASNTFTGGSEIRSGRRRLPPQIAPPG